MNLRLLSFFLLFVFSFVPVFSQDETGYRSDSTFIINSFTFSIIGFTQPFALINKADLVTGEVITGFNYLEKYIQDKTQLLVNERVLKDNVKIEYTIDEITDDEKFPVDLTIYVEDTWNIVAIPRPQYTSNSGFDLTVKARDYNFLGTMSPLRLDVGYQRDLEERNFVTVMLDSGIPFRAFGYNWHFNFDHDVQYRPNMEQHWYYYNVTGISVDIPVFFTTPTFGFEVAFTVNEENSDFDKPDYGNFQEGLYISTRPFISWKIPTSLMIGEYGELIYTPGVSTTFNHEISPWILSDNRRGPFFDLYHSLGFGRINWIGNFQEGFSAKLSNSFKYDFYRYAYHIYPLSSSIHMAGIGHFTITNFMGFSTRLMYRHWFNTFNDKAGDALRGVYDRDIKADFMVSLNLDLPLRALRIRPSEWFGMRRNVFDFDLHISPVLDMAVYQHPGTQGDFNSDSFLISGGFEIIVFPDFFRSLYLRISAGWDFSDISKRTPMELFVGTELHF